jgi:hypothetical protein
MLTDAEIPNSGYVYGVRSMSASTKGPPEPHHIHGIQTPAPPFMNICNPTHGEPTEVLSIHDLTYNVLTQVLYILNTTSHLADLTVFLLQPTENTSSGPPLESRSTKCHPIFLLCLLLRPCFYSFRSFSSSTTTSTLLLSNGSTNLISSLSCKSADPPQTTLG